MGAHRLDWDDDACASSHHLSKYKRMRYRILFVRRKLPLSTTERNVLRRRAWVFLNPGVLSPVLFSVKAVVGLLRE